jgi:hypothetical protein
MNSRLGGATRGGLSLRATHNLRPSESQVEVMSNQVGTHGLPGSRGSSFSLAYPSHFKILILGLAMAVILWGLGYKLSLYHHAPHTANVSMAKLCADPRNTSAQRGLATVQRQSPTLEHAASQPPVPPPEDSDYFLGSRALDVQNIDCCANFHSLQRALRSPPPQIS